MFSTDEAKRTMTRSLLYGPFGFLVTSCLVFGWIGLGDDTPSERGGAQRENADVRGERETGTYCGSPAAAADAVRSHDDWESWNCQSASMARDWSQCLPRARYTSQRGRGCPGATRCCPP